MENREFYRIGNKIRAQKEDGSLGERITTQDVIAAGFYDAEARTLSISVSKRREGDVYNKKIGKVIAMGRAKSAHPHFTATVVDTDARAVGKAFRLFAEKFMVENDKVELLSSWNFN